MLRARDALPTPYDFTQTWIGGVSLQRSIVWISLERRTLDLLHPLHPDMEIQGYMISLGGNARRGDARGSATYKNDAYLQGQPPVDKVTASDMQHYRLRRGDGGYRWMRASGIASTSESHGGDLIIQRYDQSGRRVGLLQCSHSLKGARQVRGQSRGRGSDDESSGAQLPKSKASVRKDVDSKEHHSAAKADLPITKEGMKMQDNG
ncbi:hypothetical protein BHM03_00054615 [Ensete ventricosum]|nr:hypothetical protein BHM03_00054615 [Ensete ventricosum]